MHLVATNEAPADHCCRLHDRLHLADCIRGAANRLSAAIVRGDFTAQLDAEADLDSLKAKARAMRVAA